MEREPLRNDAEPLAVYSFSGEVLVRLGAALVFVHVLFLGVGGVLLDFAWPSGLDFLVPLGAALLVLVPAHEGLHTMTARRLGHEAGWEIRFPKVFTTVNEPIPRDQVVLIALAPLVVLNSAALALFLLGPFRLFAALCWLLNAVGSTGDIWLVLKLLAHDRGTWVVATDAGVEVWPATLDQP